MGLFKDALAKVKTAKKRVGKALSVAKTKSEKARANALKRKAEREEAEIKANNATIKRLEKQKKHLTTKKQLRDTQRRIDEKRSEISYRSRIATGIKNNANKTIDKTLKKYGL